MGRRACSRGFLGLAFSLAIGTCLLSPTRADEDPRTVPAFLQGLRDKGYFDLAADYLEALRSQPDTPADVREIIDFELGRMLLDEASRSGDLVRRKELLDAARARLDTFAKAAPNHPKAPEALVQLARLLVERGHLAMLQADETEVQADKETKLAEARSSFDEASLAYEAADKRLTAEFEKFPKFIPENDPRRDERDRVHNGMMDAQLQHAIVDYEQGQTFPAGSKERTDFMSKALEQFDGLYKKYRTQFAGLAARMWQGKCYEERGDLGPAMGVYNELMGHTDPRLRVLQRHVGYFRIIVLGKRKEYALAADEAVRWLQSNGGAEAQRSREGLGVQLELAKDIIAQLPEVQNETDKNAALKRIIDTLSNVIRFASPYKAEAVALLRKYKPSAAVKATEVARLSYEDAVAQGEQAVAAHEWDRAATLFKQAIRRAELARDVDKTNYARYNLSFVYYMDKRYYEAAVLAEHLARRYPRGGLSAKAAEIAMAAHAEAYNALTQVDRLADLNNLLEIAKYTAETYADRDQGDTARMTLGQIHHGTGRYKEAVAAYEGMRPKSAKFVEAQTRAGASHWELSQALRRDGKNAEADAETTKALAVLDAALKARRDVGTPVTDAGLIGNVCDIAEIQLETGKADDALKLLDPIARAQPPSASGPAPTRLTATMLRAHIGTSQVDKAMADMAALEKLGGGTSSLTQLYYSLGKLLEKEKDALRKKGDSAGLNRMRQSYLKFLDALAASKTGQTYESLQWVGENMLTMGNPKEAEAVFRRILDTFGKDTKFLAQATAASRVLRTRIKLIASLRAQRKFDEARARLTELTTQNPSTIEVLMERGHFLEEMARAGKLDGADPVVKAAEKAGTKLTPWGASATQWRSIALRLGQARTKPLEYYEAWYHAALAMNEEKKSKEAMQTLAGIMRLSPNVGGPEMKEKYVALLNQLKGPSQNRPLAAGGAKP